MKNKTVDIKMISACKKVTRQICSCCGEPDEDNKCDFYIPSHGIRGAIFDWCGHFSHESQECFCEEAQDDK